MSNPDTVATCCETGLREPMDRADAERTASLLKAIADPTRLQLLSLIASSPDATACACDLVAPVGLSQPTVSHHLKVLTDADILTRERRGTWAWFTVNKDRIQEIERLFAQ